MPHVKEKRLSHTQKEPSGTRDGCRSGLGPHVCNLGLRTRRLGGKPAVIVNAIAEGHLHVPLRQLDKVGLFGRRTIIWVRRETPGYGLQVGCCIYHHHFLETRPGKRKSKKPCLARALLEDHSPGSSSPSFQGLPWSDASAQACASEAMVGGKAPHGV